MKEDAFLEALAREPKPELPPFFAARVVARLEAAPVPRTRSLAGGIAAVVISGAGLALLAPVWPGALTTLLLAVTPVVFALSMVAPRVTIGAGRGRLSK